MYLNIHCYNNLTFKSASDEWGRVSLLQQQNKKTCKVQTTKRKVNNISEIYISL